MGGIAETRLRIVLATIDQRGAHAGVARGIEFLDHIGEEQDVVGGAVEAPRDFAIPPGLALVSDFGIEPATEQASEVAGIGMAEAKDGAWVFVPLA